MNLLNDEIKRRMKETLDNYDLQLVVDSDIEYIMGSLFEEFKSQCLEYIRPFNEAKPMNTDELSKRKTWPKINLQ